MAEIREIHLRDGKYTVRFDSGKYNGYGAFLQPLRRGVAWPAYEPDGMSNLEQALARRVMELEDELVALKGDR